MNHNVTAYPFASLFSLTQHLTLLCSVLDILEEVDLQQSLSQHHTLQKSIDKQQKKKHIFMSCVYTSHLIRERNKTWVGGGGGGAEAGKNFREGESP